MKEKVLENGIFSDFSSSSCFGTYFFCFRTSFSCFRTSFPISERPFPVSVHHFPVLELPFSVLERVFPGFLGLILSRDVPGQRDKLKILPRAGTGRDRLSKPCHGTGRAGTACQNLGRDTGRDKKALFVPGQRDNGMSRPGLSRDVPRDVTSLGNPSSYSAENKPFSL